MKTAAFVLSASVLAAVPFAPASAQVTQGLYLGVSGGMGMLRDGDVGNAGRAEYDLGWAALGAIGYQFGDFRLEFEPGYRSNDVNGLSNAASASGGTSALSGMVNVYHDFLPASAFNPYLGVGAGAARVTGDAIVRNGVTVADGSDTVFAYQGVAGATYAFTRGLAVDAAYRYFDTADAKIGGSDLAYRSHTISLGLVYRFGEAVMGSDSRILPAAPNPPPPSQVAQATRPPAQTPVAPPPAQATPARPNVYIVFFAFDRADITPVAAQEIDRAIANFRATGSTSIKLEGHADRAGSDRYNLALSKRRADAVAAYLRAKGVDRIAVNEEWFGETRPRVQTADGVRNDENRRVEILLRR